jgi:hypothetical protein
MRSSQRIADRSESVFLAPAMVSDAAPSMAGLLQARVRSDEEESVASFASCSSVASGASRDKKRRILCTIPDVTEERMLEMRTSSTADISVELTRQIAEILEVATTSSNLKGTYVKALRDAASSIAAGTIELSRLLPAHSNTGASRIAEARLSVLEEENAALRKELSRRIACVHECSRYSGSASESGRSLREGKSESARLAALERKVEEIGPSIIRAIEERFRGRQRSPEARRRTEHSPTRSTTHLPRLPREQEGGEWKVVESKKKEMKKKKRKTTVGEAAKKGATAAPLARGQQPQTRTTGAPKPNAAATVKKGSTETPKKPRSLAHRDHLR